MLNFLLAQMAAFVRSITLLRSCHPQLLSISEDLLLPACRLLSDMNIHRKGPWNMQPELMGNELN